MLFAGISLSTFNAFIVLFLEIDLLTAIAIITIIISFRNFLQIFLRVPLGELSQIVGRKPLIIFGNLSFTVAFGFLFLATDWVLVFFAIFFVSIGMSSFWPALFSYIGDVSQEKYGENNGRIFQGGDIGTIFGTLIASYLLNSLHYSLHELFNFIFVISLIFVVILILMLPETLTQGDKKQVEAIPKALYYSFRNMLQGVRQMSFSKGLGIIYIWQYVIAFLEFMFTAFFPVLIVTKGFSKGTVADIALVATILIIWFKPLMGRFSDRYGYERPIVSTLIISGIILIVMVYTKELWIFIILYAIIVGSFITAFTSVNGGIVKKAPNSQRGIALGTLGFYVSIGRTSSTIFLGPIWDQFSISAVFLLSGVSIIIITVGLYALVNLRYTKLKNYIYR